MSEEKKYWLERLSELNTMSERLLEYMKELSDAGQELSRIEGGGRGSTVATVPVTVRTPRTDSCSRWSQQRLQTAQEETRTGQAEIERRSGEVVGMLAEVLRIVNAERDGAIGRALERDA